MLFLKIIQLIASFEGFTHTPYFDRTQYTVGYGTKAEDPTMCVTVREADRMLAKDTIKHFNVVDNAHLNNNQVVSLTSFSYNVGSSAYRHSKVAKLANQGKICEAAKELKTWVYAGGKKSPGLVKRRVLEAKLLTEGVKC